MALHRPAHSAPRDVYLHLLATLTLFISTISLLTVLFQYINLLLPDPLNFFRQDVLDTIRGASSSLIVAFPLFIWVSSILYRDLRQDPARHELVVRKWLTYFTLLVAAVSMIVYLIMLVNGLYGGELSLSFSLKVLAVVAVAGAVFGYYLWDVRTEKPGALPRKIAVGSSAFVAIVLVAGLVLVGSPAQQRKVRFDAQRVSDLQSLQGQIVNYFTSTGQLPATQAQLADSISGYTAPLDPATQQPYDYRVTGTYSFELCASFESVGTDDTNRSYTAPIAVPTDAAAGKVIGDLSGSWTHPAGHTCFARTIDPQRYRPPTQ